MTIDTRRKIDTVRHASSACFIAGFAFVTAWLSPRLSYYQDEWSLLQSQVRPLGGALVSHMGHFFPIGKLIYWLETVVFGANYRGLIWVNAATHAAGVMLLLQWFVNHSGLRQSRLIQLAVVSVLLTSASAMYSIQIGMQIKWLLDIVFALALLKVVCIDQRISGRVLFLTVLTIFTFTSTALTLLLLVASLITHVGERLSRASLWLTVFALTGGITGSLLAGVWLPTDVNARGWPVEYGEALLGWRDVLRWTSALALTWLIAPLSIVGPSDRNYATTVGEFLSNQYIASVIAWSVVILTLLIIFGRSHGTTAQRLRPFFVLGVTVFSALLTVLFRLNNTRDFFAIRYGPLFLLLASVYWAFVMLHPHKSSLIRWIQRGLGVLLTATALTGLLRFTSTIEAASDLERVRDTVTQIEELQKCGRSNDIVVLRTIQNSLTGPEMCEIASNVRGLISEVPRE